MKFQIRFNYVPMVLLILLIGTILLGVKAETYEPTGKTKAKKPPPKHCNRENKCSLPVSHGRKATLTLNGFQKGEDGGGPSACDNRFHSDNTRVVALPIGLFKEKQRCLKHITIYGNGREVDALVVDKCECSNNIVDASKAVWKALGVPQKEWGQLNVYWSDA